MMKMAEIPEEVMELIIKSGIDDKLETIAMKEKLTGIHVRNIIKQVVTDRSVLALLKSGIYGTEIEDPDFLSDFQPKLTRSRKKELLEKQAKEGVQNQSLETSSVLGLCSSYSDSPSGGAAAWPFPETLVTTEFPEEDDDDEYHPELDNMVVSDEESLASSFGSPSTFSMYSGHSRSASASKTPSSDYAGQSPLASLRKDLSNPRLHLVQKCLKFNLDESLICSRTRSKCPLTDTPLEQLEMAFQPPDITADMYETDVIDEDWRKFLLDLSQPQDGVKAPEDDEQIDPEYNLIADAEEGDPSPDEWKEELRGDKAVKISKKEVDGLLEEMMDSSVSDEDEIDDCENNLTASVVASTDSSFVNNNSVLRKVVTIDAMNKSTKECTQEAERLYPSNNEVTFEEKPSPAEFTKQQLQLLKCQFTKHIQLLTQSILMTCYEEKFNHIEVGCKKMLKDMQYLGSQNFVNAEYFRGVNMEGAVNTIEHFDSKREEHLLERKRKLNQKLENCGSRNYERNYVCIFPPIIQRIFALSSALPFVDLLPKGAFPPTSSRARKGFTTSEYYLLAMAFKDVVTDINIFNSEFRKNKSKYFDADLAEICNRVAENSCVLTSGTYLGAHFSRLLKQNLHQNLHEDNPLIKFKYTGDIKLPQSDPEDEVQIRRLCPLKEVELETLPLHFRRIVERFKKSEKLTLIPCDSNKSRGKIVIIENPCEMNIILPPPSIHC